MVKIRRKEWVLNVQQQKSVGKDRLAYQMSDTALAQAALRKQSALAEIRECGGGSEGWRQLRRSVLLFVSGVALQRARRVECEMVRSGKCRVQDARRRSCSSR